MKRRRMIQKAKKNKKEEGKTKTRGKNVENVDDEETDASSKKRSQKQQGLTILLETKIQNFDVKVEVTGLFNYYDVFHRLIFLHDVYRATNKSLELEYKIEYYHNSNWIEFLPSDYDKLLDKTKMRVINRTFSIPVQLPVVERPKQQYIGINLKALQELPTGLIGGKLNPYVTLWVSAHKQHKYKTLMKPHTTGGCTFNENFVIPVSFSCIQKGKITCFLELAVFSSASHGSGSDAKLGKAQFPLPVLERGHAKPIVFVIKLDKGGFVDMEVRWFENDQLIVSPEDTKGFRRSIGIGGVFFTPPSLVKAKNLKKPRADELEWFQNLPPIPLKDIHPGDIVIVKFYDVVYEEDKPHNEMFYKIVEDQKDIPLTKATCFSVSSFIVTKEGGENIGIQCTGGISLETKFPNYNCLVYRCKNSEYAKEAVTWAQEVYQKHPNIKYSPLSKESDEYDITPNVENQNQMSAREVPDNMMDSEFVAGAYQCRKGNPMINSFTKNLTPCLLENHLNSHLENDFSFVGIVVQHIDEQEIARRGLPKMIKKSRSVKGDKGLKQQRSVDSSNNKKNTKLNIPKKEPIKVARVENPPGVHKPVFGLPLAEVCIDGVVPHFWECVFGFLNQEDPCSQEGIFRVPGNAEEAIYYKRLFEEGREVVFDCGCHDVVGLLKMYIRELPECVIPPIIDGKVPKIMAQYKDENVMLREVKKVINQLPKPNYIFFKLLMSLLYSILQQSEINMMNSDNIIRCIVPTMKCGPQIVAISFNNYPYIFREGDEEDVVNTDDKVVDENKNENDDQSNTHPRSNPQRANRGVRTTNNVQQQLNKDPNQPKETANRQRPAWMGREGVVATSTTQSTKTEPQSEVTFGINKITINVDANDDNEKELTPVTPRKGETEQTKQNNNNKRRTRVRSEVYFYNLKAEGENLNSDSALNALESAYRLAEAHDGVQLVEPTDANINENEDEDDDEEEEEETTTEEDDDDDESTNSDSSTNTSSTEEK